MLKDHQIDEVQSLLADVAEEVILPRFRSLNDADIEQKSGPFDLVTIADQEAERLITPRLKDILPGSVVVGEEAVAADAQILHHLKEDAPVWLVDPVDGTLNFVEGRERFGMLVALVYRGQTLAGFTYIPTDGRFATAFRGGGAYVNGHKLGAVKSAPFEEAVGDYSSRFFAEPFSTEFTARLSGVKEARHGHCSAHAYLEAATGEIDFILQYQMTPWDHAAGTLMLNEIGGAARFLDDGSPYTPIERAPRPMLAVGHGAAWDAFLDKLRSSPA